MKVQLCSIQKSSGSEIIFFDSDFFLSFSLVSPHNFSDRWLFSFVVIAMINSRPTMSPLVEAIVTISYSGVVVSCAIGVARQGRIEAVQCTIIPTIKFSEGVPRICDVAESVFIFEMYMR